MAENDKDVEDQINDVYKDDDPTGTGALDSITDNKK